MAIRQFFCSITGQFTSLVHFVADSINQVYGEGHATYNTSAKTVTITDCLGRENEEIHFQYGSETQFSTYPMAVSIDEEKNFLMHSAKGFTVTTQITERIGCILYDDINGNHITFDYNTYTKPPFRLPTSVNFTYTSIPMRNSGLELEKIYLIDFILGDTILPTEVKVSNYRTVSAGKKLITNEGHIYVSLVEDIYYKLN